MKYAHVISEVLSTPWLIRPEKLSAILSLLRLKASGGEVSAEDIASIKRSARAPFLVSRTGQVSAFHAGELQATAVAHGQSDGKDDSGAWDGAAAEEHLRKWASSDGSGDKDTIDWAKYRRGFAWYDENDEQNFAAYKLPHHDVKDGKFILVLRGVEAAMGALLGARGTIAIPASDRRPVYDHLAAEYREFGKEPPNFHGEKLTGTKASAPSSSSRSRAGSVAVLPLFGVISYRMGMMSESSGGTSTERFTQWFRAALADATVKAIIIDIDSPGGTVSGVPELADEIYKARGQKPVVAIANAEAASAAYWLGCQADELVVTPSGEVGSVGVWCAHQDVSKFMEQQGVKTTLVSSGKYKVEGNPYEPLSADGLAALQQSCDEVYDTFLRAVARGREASVAEVRANFGEGRMVSAAKAVKAGMADRTGTLDQTLARLGAKPKEKLPERVAFSPEDIANLIAAQEKEDSAAAAAAATVTSESTASAQPTLTEPERAARQRERELELYRT